MENIIAVFSNRNQAMQFASVLKRIGIRTKTINTPRDLSVSCGISIVFENKHLGQARIVVERLGLYSSVRMYLVSGDLFKKYLLIR